MRVRQVDVHGSTCLREVGRAGREYSRELLDRFWFTELGEHVSAPSGQVATAEEQELKLRVCRLGWQ
jgi:hypothetical protein